MKLGLESPGYRRWQFELITLFKIVNGKYKELFKQFFVFTQTNYNLRGYDKKPNCKYSFKNSQWQNSFSEEQ